MQGATILLRRGNESDIPILQLGEPGFAIDTGKLFVGGSAGNVQITGGAGTGVSTFIGLNDSPSTYVSHSKRLIRVNSVENALEFVEDGEIDAPLGIGTIPASNLHNAGGFHNTGSGNFEGNVIAQSKMVVNGTSIPASATLQVNGETTISGSLTVDEQVAVGLGLIIGTSYVSPSLIPIAAGQISTGTGNALVISDFSKNEIVSLYPSSLGQKPEFKFHTQGSFIDRVYMASKLSFGENWGIEPSNDVVTNGLNILNNQGAASNIAISLSAGRIGILGSAITGDHLIYLAQKARAGDGLRVDNGLSMIDGGQQLIFVTYEDSLGAGHTDVYSYNTDSAAYQPFNLRGSRFDFIDNSGTSRMSINGTQVSIGASGGPSDININGNLYIENTCSINTGSLVLQSGSALRAIEAPFHIQKNGRTAYFGIGEGNAQIHFDAGINSVADMIFRRAGQNRFIFRWNDSANTWSVVATDGATTLGTPFAINRMTSAIDIRSNDFEIKSIAGFNRFKTGSGIMVGTAPTGGDKGAGTANFQGDIYKNNSAYNNPDYVLENYFTGEIKRFIDNDGAKTYPGTSPLEDVLKYAKENMRLPRISTASGIFNRSDRILEKIEELFIYLWQTNERLDKIENKLKD